MYMKVCPECEKKSYSASKIEEWTCPYCNENLTDIEAKISDNSDNQRKEE